MTEDFAVTLRNKGQCHQPSQPGKAYRTTSNGNAASQAAPGFVLYCFYSYYATLIAITSSSKDDGDEKKDNCLLAWGVGPTRSRHQPADHEQASFHVEFPFLFLSYHGQDEEDYVRRPFS